MKEILNEICSDPRITEISMGTIRPFSEYSGWEYYGATSKNDKADFPFPPLFIPIIIDYNSTPVAEGIIKHWFCEREYTFGYIDFGNGFLIGESARSYEQFIEGMLFEQFIDQFNYVMTDEFLSLAKKLQISKEDLSKFYEISERETNNTECFLPIFIENQPLNCIYNKNNYDGSHPSNESVIIERNILQASFFEIFQKEWLGYDIKNRGFSIFNRKPKYQPLDNIPDWLKPDIEKKELFEYYMVKKEYDKAWLTINGPGFNPNEVGERLQRLKQVSTEKAFHLWADFWCSKYGYMDSFIFV
ncbi:MULTISPECIES: hypothetical protein [Sphingobacterium]|uniref:hypothetical protein n=1 Tax=Sphingobacterium TaxID=28453 RepID=UPI00257E4390|nr:MULTISPECIES: hypothetical protein [Sphingobacterium]